ncbi:MAG: hypothetical protein K2P64_08505 [Lachnospiraceae bacterium]|nr:hypothetical protein [Lachnospiraceae bacterium]
MDRMKKLEQAAGEYLPERYVKSKEFIRAYYAENHREVYGELEKIVRRGIQRCKDSEKQVKHIVISVLFSSILTKSYELQVAFLDERIYMDDAPVEEYWTPEFIFERIEEDIQCFRKTAALNIPRIKEYEVEPIRNAYAFHHYFPVMLLLREIIPDIVENICSQYDVLDNAAMVSFGRHMEKGVLLYQRGKRDEIFSY